VANELRRQAGSMEGWKAACIILQQGRGRWDDARNRLSVGSIKLHQQETGKAGIRIY
jgi:hypothetical protein